MRQESREEFQFWTVALLSIAALMAIAYQVLKIAV